MSIQYKPYLPVLCIELNHATINSLKNTNLYGAEYNIMSACTGTCTYMKTA